MQILLTNDLWQQKFKQSICPQAGLSNFQEQKMAKGRRQTFYFPEQAAKMLSAIKQKSRIDNNADVVRSALTAYDDLLEITRTGCRIFVLDAHGREWPFSPFVRSAYPGLADESPEPPDVGKAEKAPKNFVFSADASTRLESIRERSFLQSNADTIRAALAVYNELLRVAANGDQIFVRDRAGTEHAYVPFSPFDLSALATNAKGSAPLPQLSTKSNGHGSDLTVGPTKPTLVPAL